MSDDVHEFPADEDRRHAPAPRIVERKGDQVITRSLAFVSTVRGLGVVIAVAFIAGGIFASWASGLIGLPSRVDANDLAIAALSDTLHQVEDRVSDGQERIGGRVDSLRNAVADVHALQILTLCTRNPRPPEALLAAVKVTCAFPASGT